MKRARILVVDDEPGMLAAVARVLGRRHDVSCCATPREALAAARAQPAELALIDVRLPEMSGFELIERLRESTPDLDVIIMTGSVHDLDARMVQAIRANAYYFIQKPFDRDVILTLVERAVETRRLTRENRLHTARLERELQLARVFQQSLLPPRTTTVGRIRFAAHYVPCTELGGDLYDYVALRAGLAFLVADVSGHGVAAAMLTGIVKSAFHTCHDVDFEPSVVAGRVAEGLRPFGTNRFVTLFAGRVDSVAARLTYVNAGHPGPLLWSAQQALRELESTGPLLSPIFAGDSWQSARLDLRRGDQLLLYTDGLVDRERVDAQPYGADRLRAIVAQGGGADPSERILADADLFAGGTPPSDDVTLAWIAVD